MKKALSLSIAIFCLVCYVPSQSKNQPTEETLTKYLRSHWLSPEDYVVGKFKKYDIVFIGEYHRIRHDVELIHNLIPRLYKAGIYNLGIEFGRYEDQNKIDRLITAETYDEDLARWLQFKQFVAWGFTEYEDIYRKAWELNRSLPANAPKFRVVGLGYKVDWTQMQEVMTDELWKKVWHDGDPDAGMGAVVLKEFVDKGRKALIYSGTHHAFTRYRQPRWDYQKHEFLGFRPDLRMGNVVYARIPKKVFNIFLHSPWANKDREESAEYPVGGVIDRVMMNFSNKRVGFDVSGSPFGRLLDNSTYYSAGYQDFKLADFADGYIFQKPMKEYEGVTVDENFITDDNLQEAINNVPNFAARKFYKKPSDMLDAMKNDTNFKRRFRNLQPISSGH